MASYIVSIRAVKKGKFSDDIGDTLYLVVPDGQLPDPSHAVSADKWFAAVQKAASWKNPDNKEPRGDLLFYVHGYNMTKDEVIQRHRRLADGLSACGFKGAVASFDWPSDDRALAYLPDRHKAKMTAMRLMTDAISYLSSNQRPDCTLNIHVLGHSTGAYVIREAFDDADDAQLANGAWSVSQVILVAGDISSGSMSRNDSGAKSIYGHCVRLTNYFSRYDEALDISNVKRLGSAPRVGRIGLPPDAPDQAVNVDCSEYFKQLNTDPAVLKQDEPEGIVGLPTHSWYFGNAIFTKDLFFTIIGTDRQSIPTRSISSGGQITLIRA